MCSINRRPEAGAAPAKGRAAQAPGRAAVYGGSPARWQEDSEKPDFVCCKASGRSVSIFRAWLLKGQVPAKVFIFLSSVCALIEVTPLYWSPPTPRHPTPAPALPRLSLAQLMFYLNCQ